MSHKVAHSRRPVFLAPFQIQMPVGACTSIAHRIAGILMAIGVPFAVYLLHMSLVDEKGFGRVKDILGSWPVRVVVPLMVWALAHHLLAGLRHLLTDIGVGSSLQTARRSAWIVNVTALLFAATAAGVLW